MIGEWGGKMDSDNDRAWQQVRPNLRTPHLCPPPLIPPSSIAHQPPATIKQPLPSTSQPLHPLNNLHRARPSASTLQEFAAYQTKQPLVGSFYWCLNPNSGDTGGLLLDDWITPHQEKLDLLEPLLTGN